MPKRYKVLLRFSGTALVEVEGDTVEAVRRAVTELELADITRVGHSDILSLEIVPREITQSIGPGDIDEDASDAANRPRPSGWYRPS